MSAADPDDALVITADGKGVPVRPEALRPGTAKLATKATTSATDGSGSSGSSGGGKPHRKRMAELVCVYDLTPVPRTVEDLVRGACVRGWPEQIAAWCRTLYVCCWARVRLGDALGALAQTGPGRLSVLVGHHLGVRNALLREPAAVNTGRGSRRPRRRRWR